MRTSRPRWRIDTVDNCPQISNPTQQDSDSTALNVTGASAVWRFEETSGTSATDSVGGNTGTLAGGVARISTGKVGRALSFDGTDDAVTTPLNINESSSSPGVTMEAWVFPTSNSSGRHHVISTDNGGYDWSLLREGGTWYVFTGADSVSTGMAVDLNQWQHVAAVFIPGTGVRFYKNGTAVALTSIDYDTSDGNVAVGRNPGYPEFFAGTIDEVAVYPRALTETEVKAHAKVGLYGDGMGDACDACPTAVSATCAPSTCLDQDGDGYGVQGSSACAGHVSSFDCDDANAATHPGAVDGCDDVDNDCDGRKDEGCLASPQSTTYVYNAFNQLLSATGPAGTTTFSYDDNGNQTTKVEPSASTVFVWDARDRLVEVQLPGGGVNRFGYDTDNLRVLESNSMHRSRVLLGMVDEIAEYDLLSSEQVAHYVHDPGDVDLPLMESRSGTKTMPIVDALHSLYKTVDMSGKLEVSYAYDVYGSRLRSYGADDSKWGFTGRNHEYGHDIIYYRSRFYDATIGRLVSDDPMRASFSIREQNPDLLNGYAYVSNQPTRFRDPSGFSPTFGSACGKDVKDAWGEALNYLDRAIHSGLAPPCCLADNSMPTTARWTLSDLSITKRTMTSVIDVVSCESAAFKCDDNPGQAVGCVQTVRRWASWLPWPSDEVITVAPAPAGLFATYRGTILHEAAHQALNIRAHDPKGFDKPTVIGRCANYNRF